MGVRTAYRLPLVILVVILSYLAWTSVVGWGLWGGRKYVSGLSRGELEPREDVDQLPNFDFYHNKLKKTEGEEEEMREGGLFVEEKDLEEDIWEEHVETLKKSKDGVRF